MNRVEYLKNESKRLSLEIEIAELEKTRDSYEWNDPFSSKPIALVNAQWRITDKINELSKQLNLLKQINNES